MAEREKAQEEEELPGEELPSAEAAGPDAGAEDEEIPGIPEGAARKRGRDAGEPERALRAREDLTEGGAGSAETRVVESAPRVLEEPPALPAAPSPRGEKRAPVSQRAPSSWLDASAGGGNSPSRGEAGKSQRIGAILRQRAEMAAAGVGAPEGSFTGRFARADSAAVTFMVAAVMPTAADDKEAALLAAFQGRSLTKPVYDAVSGVPLDDGLVRAARTEELGYARKHGVYEKVPRAQARARGKKVIGTKWLDINKGDDKVPVIRSRLVAKELRAFAPWVPQEDLFAATPPAAAQNLLLSLMVS